MVRIIKEGLTEKLHVAKQTGIALQAGQTLYVPMEIPVVKMKIQSIEVVCNKNTRFEVEFYEAAQLTDSKYKSLESTGRLLDVLDYTYIDTTGFGRLHLTIRNMDIVEATYSVEVRGFQLK